MPEKPLLCSVVEAGRLLSISRSRIYELMNEGAIESVKLGKRRLVTTSSIDSFAQSLSDLSSHHSTAATKGC